jgi:serine/threonine protein kinase
MPITGDNAQLSDLIPAAQLPVGVDKSTVAPLLDKTLLISIMPVSVGDKLGQYEILAPIGAGGMGEVYRARDTKLKRDVALKVLPDAHARDPERMAHFQREAEVLALLNQPNIAHIQLYRHTHGVGRDSAAISHKVLAN